MKLSIIIPVYNECSTVGEIINRVSGVKLDHIEKEIIVVDDASTDGSTEIIRREYQKRLGIMKTHLSIIQLGKGAAVRFGFKYATGDIVIIQDADLELNPEEYSRLIEPILSGRVKVVYGSRFRKTNLNIPLITRLANRFLVLLTNMLYGSSLTDMETAYKVFHKDVIGSISLRSVGFEFEPEITAKVLRAGFKIEEVPITYNPRTTEEGKKIKWKDGIWAIYILIENRFGTS